MLAAVTLADVVVDMQFAGVNPVDHYGALGRVAPDAPLPRTLGMEGVGQVAGVTYLVHGRGMGTTRDGVWSEKAIVAKDALVEVPESVPPEEAAAMGVAGVTAWRTVTELGQVSPEDRVLILGASGGVGSMAVSVAHSCGATVWGQTGHAAKEKWISDQGADHVVVSDVAGLQVALGDYRPTVVIDPLGDGFTGAAIAVMAPHGRLVIFGTSAGGEGQLPLQALYRKGLTVLGYAGLLASDETLARAKRDALKALAEGRLKATIDSVRSLVDVNEAFNRLDDRSVTGKIILDLHA